MSDIVDRMQKRVETINRVGGDLIAKAMFIEAIAEIQHLREELRWIPVTEKLPPEDGTDVDFLSLRGCDGYGHMYRQTKEISDQLLLYPEPVMIEYEAGPYHIGKDPRGSWEVTHWRLRPGTEPDFDKFIKENT